MRSRVEAAEALLDKVFPVLDHGHVILTDYMGSDDDIANAARVSNAGQVEKKSSNRGLIRYLLRHHHTSPFEMVEFKFICRMPIFVARQWIRHRTANVNEASGRYSVLPDEFYVPSKEQVCAQSKGNNQGRSSNSLSEETASTIIRLLKVDAEEAFRRYHMFLGDNPSLYFANDAIQKEIVESGGLARELARINLPLSTYTEWVWKIDLHNLLRFLALRMDEHAQWEIQQYAKSLFNIVSVVCPIATEAFEDYLLNAITFSRHELQALAKVLHFGAGISNTSSLKEKVMATIPKFSSREADEFLAKITQIQKYL